MHQIVSYAKPAINKFHPTVITTLFGFITYNVRLYFTNILSGRGNGLLVLQQALRYTAQHVRHSTCFIWIHCWHIHSRLWPCALTHHRALL